MSGRTSGWRWAVGEIFIVVVGVLIALGVNNWRQSLADRHTETQYLRSLLQDLDNDSMELARAESQGRVYERAGWTVLGVLNGKKAAILGDSLALAVEYAGFLYLPAYFPYTFSELVNTGDLRIIRDPKLRRAIAAYYNLIDSEKQWWNRYRGIQTVYTQEIQGTLGPAIRGRIVGSEPLDVSQADRRRILREIARRPKLSAALEGMIWCRIARCVGITSTWRRSDGSARKSRERLAPSRDRKPAGPPSNKGLNLTG